MRNAVKVLIVDDDKSSATVLGEVVKRLGFKPVIAHKPADALNVVRLQTVQAALVDVLLPKMSGVDLVTEFRKTKFGEAPVVFVSGVFKDKAFAADAMKKTGAVDFLFKPFGPEELTECLNKALANLVIAEKWSVQSLVTRKFTTAREQARAIENLEQIKGRDFPYLLHFMLSADVSGNLNIVNDAGEIFGVSFNKGTVVDVDSAESQSTAILALIQNGFFAQEDWDAYQANNAKKNFPLERLVEEGFVSPHAVATARHDQILSDLKAICSGETLQINLSAQESTSEPPKHAVRADELIQVFMVTPEEFFTLGYLTSFYESVLKHPVVMQAPEQAEAVWTAEQFKAVVGLKSIIDRAGSIDEMLTQFPDAREKVLQAIHFLLMNRAIRFDDPNRTKNTAVVLERYKKLYAELSSRTPDKIFEYFGAASNAPKQALDSIRDEYLKSNNPDIIKKDGNAELTELCTKCYDLVKKAHDIMTDDLKRQAFFEEQKLKSAEKSREANRIVAEALDMLRKGQFQNALKKTKEAEAVHQTTLVFLIGVWAEMKCGAAANKPRLQEMFRKLEALPLDDRKSAYYYMALGLVKKGMGDLSASSYFEKALQMDSLLIEAKRELNTSGAPPKKEKLDLFTGDITQVVSQLFRRKAD